MYKKNILKTIHISINFLVYISFVRFNIESKKQICVQLQDFNLPQDKYI